tara:strand:- start:831 stop:1055 length:225 start_codon:yes stop_codon:yes gene_type:complete
MKILTGGKPNVGHPAISITIEDIGLAEAARLVESAHQHGVSSLTSPGSGDGRINTVHSQFDTRVPAFSAVHGAG